jgi:hypothetical protein
MAVELVPEDHEMRGSVGRRLDLAKEGSKLEAMTKSNSNIHFMKAKIVSATDISADYNLV